VSETVIKVENLSKKYVLSHQKEGQNYKALRDVIADSAKSLGKKFLKPSDNKVYDPTHEEFWALKDISFEIKQGDRVGIIGRNGAGKSTLLKILSRITEPTQGSIKIRGRVASLLEVGTGFHPELTGRENIFLNGAILGMGKVEINRKFDEIVVFAEVEKFLDTPVKRYSSGMYVRLAFAVAAHLEPEILIVDEVLAVGDAHFQKKCLGKMEDVAEKEGRTILLVSHQMAAIQNLCNRSIWLNHGTLAKDGGTEQIVSSYLLCSAAQKQISLSDRKDRKGSGHIQFTAVAFQDIEGNNINMLQTGEDLKLILYFDNLANRDLTNLHVAIGIDDQLGERITLLSSEITDENIPRLSLDAKSIEVFIKKLPLVSGRYGFTLYSTINGSVADWIQNAGFFDVESGDYYRTGKLPPAGQGSFLMNYSFQVRDVILHN
jgi:lipopolysaccharide transport system ATP-binding protein